MEIIWHYACSGSDDLLAFLKDWKISYKCAEEIGMVFFDISEHNSAFPQLSQMHLKECILTNRVKFTRDEIRSARWFTCTPTGAKLNLCREEVTFSLSERYGDNLAYHRVMSGAPFYVTGRYSRHPNQHFFTADETPNHLFCTEYAKTLLQERELPIAFCPVLHDRTEQPVGDLYDLRMEHVLPPEAVDLSNVEETFTCPACGKQTFLPPLQLRVYRSFLERAPGVCETAPVFGWGGNYAAPMVLFSKEIFSLLSENHMTRGLEFDPVEIVE